MVKIRNRFGQELGVGDWVGWGRRDGNTSSFSVGTIVALIPYASRRYDFELKEFLPVTAYKVKCRWSLHTGYTSRAPYTSTTRADDVFLLDPATLSDEIRTS